MNKHPSLLEREAAQLHDAPIQATPLATIPAGTEASVFDVIRSMASDKDADVDKFERLVALYERQEARSAERAFNDAMNLAQEEIRPIAADAKNPSTRSEYASYPALDRAVRPIYTRHGFSLSFDTGDSAADMVRVLCYVGHRDGHSRTYKVDMPADGKGAKGGDVMTKTHATGSAMSYGQRYLLKLIFNIAVGDDDDGNRAGAGEKITEAQAERLKEMLAKDGADLERFCAYVKVKCLAEIPANKFEEAIEIINTRSQNAKKKAGAL